jgi:hypothetical protein
VKYGKLPAQHYEDAEKFNLSEVLAAPLPTAPSRFGFGTLHADWGMLGNDEVGDCAIAGPAHESMIFTHVGGAEAKFTTTCVLKDYSALTGYDPRDPNTDQGTNVSELMDYRRTKGMGDAVGNRHKIELAVRIPLRNWSEFIRATHTFGCTAIGFMVPESCEQEFADGQIWDYHGDHNIVGGHYVPAVGSLSSAAEVSVITWGRRQRMTRAFFNAYVDELWVPLSAEVVKAGYGLNHVLWTKVEALAASLPHAA